VRTTLGKRQLAKRFEISASSISPSPASVVGPFRAFLTRGPGSKLKRRPGRKHAPYQVCSTETAERSFAKSLRQRSAKMSDTREAIKRLHGANCAELFGI